MMNKILINTVVVVVAITMLPHCFGSACKGSEWMCPKTSDTRKCIWKFYRCDNVPDCSNSTTDASDEVTGCPKPPMLSDIRVDVYPSKSNPSTISWSTPRDKATNMTVKITNVTINITFTDKGTGQEMSTRVYGLPKPCVEVEQCRNKSRLNCTKPVWQKYCMKSCMLCRIDSVHDNAVIDIDDILNQNVSHVMARAFASNYRGDGPWSSPVKLPVPELSAVTNLRVKIKTRGFSYTGIHVVWNSSKFIQKEGLHADDGRIRHVITKCIGDKSTEIRSDCKEEELFSGLSSQYYGLPFNKYVFSVKPVYSHRFSVNRDIVGPTETVYFVASQALKFHCNFLVLGFSLLTYFLAHGSY